MLLRDGFEFEHPTLDSAIDAMLDASHDAATD
jgi:hypothetical protein